MPVPIEELLEFNPLKEIVCGFNTCVPGRRAVAVLAPHQDVAALQTEFALIAEAVDYLRPGAVLGFGALSDPEEWLARIASPAPALSSMELLGAVSLMEAALRLARDFPGRHCEASAAFRTRPGAGGFRSLSTAIRRAVMPNGEISDDASPQLKRIRSGMLTAREKIQCSLENILRTRGEPAGEDYITLRNERFVIPVRASDRRAVPGVVHAASGTGQTVFVEPLEAIDLNNRLVQLAEEETVEIARILDELTERVRAERGPLEFAAQAIAHLDSVFARGRFARAFNAVTPEFSDGTFLIELRGGAQSGARSDAEPAGTQRGAPVALALGGLAGVAKKRRQ